MSEIKDLAPLEPDLPERRLVRRYSVVPLQPDNSEISSYLRTYWHILLKRKWTILTITLVIATLATIFAFKTKPIYQAISRVSVQGETPQFQTVQNLDEPQDPDDTYLETQVTVLKSDDLAWKTIEQLHLDQSPEFKVSASQAASNQGDPEAEEASLIQKFNRALNVHLLDGTRVIEVAFESPDASLAARVVNALVNNYIEYNFRTKYDATEQASAWMEQRLDDLKAKVEKSQEALVQYERENSIIDIGNRQNVMEQRLGSLSQDLTDAQNDLAQKQSLYQLAEANPDQVGVLVQDTLLETLQGKLGDLKTQYVNELSQYGPKFPKVLRLHDQIEEVGSLMKQEEKQTLARVQHNYLASLGREKILAAAVDQEKAAIGKASQLLVEDNILKHEFQTNESLYDGLLMHVKNATVSAGLRANNVNILDHALVPTSPVRPKKARDVAVGLVIGLMLGITVAFVQEGFDNSVRNALLRRLRWPSFLRRNRCAHAAHGSGGAASLRIFQTETWRSRWRKCRLRRLPNPSALCAHRFCFRLPRGHLKPFWSPALNPVKARPQLLSTLLSALRSAAGRCSSWTVTSARLRSDTPSA